MATKNATPVLVPLTPEMRGKLEQKAEELERSMAWVVRQALESYFAA